MTYRMLFMTGLMMRSYMTYRMLFITALKVRSCMMYRMLFMTGLMIDHTVQNAVYDWSNDRSYCTDCCL